MKIHQNMKFLLDRHLNRPMLSNMILLETRIDTVQVPSVASLEEVHLLLKIHPRRRIESVVVIVVMKTIWINLLEKKGKRERKRIKYKNRYVCIEENIGVEFRCKMSERRKGNKIK